LPTSTTYPSPFLSLLHRPLPRSTLFPYTTLFRSPERRVRPGRRQGPGHGNPALAGGQQAELRAHQREHRPGGRRAEGVRGAGGRSEEHTSELQSRENLVCRLLLEKKKK